jgi:hypothetical protein
MSALQEARPWTVRMAASDKWNSIADPGTAIHAVRGDRLVPASTRICAVDGAMKRVFLLGNLYPC